MPPMASPTSASRAAGTITVTANGDPVALTAGATLDDLIATLALRGRRIAVEHNGHIVPRSRYAQTCLADGDRIEIVHAVGGG